MKLNRRSIAHLYNNLVGQFYSMTESIPFTWNEMLIVIAWQLYLCAQVRVMRWMESMREPLNDNMYLDYCSSSQESIGCPQHPRVGDIPQRSWSLWATWQLLKANSLESKFGKNFFVLPASLIHNSPFVNRRLNSLITRWQDEVFP